MLKYRQVDIVEKASSFVQKNLDIGEKMEQANGTVSACKEKLNETYAQVLKEKDELKMAKELNIRMGAKDVIR